MTQANPAGDQYDLEDHLEGSQGTGVLIPQAQIMEVLHNLNVSSPIKPLVTLCL